MTFDYLLHGYTFITLNIIKLFGYIIGLNMVNLILSGLITKTSSFTFKSIWKKYFTHFNKVLEYNLVIYFVFYPDWVCKLNSD